MPQSPFRLVVLFIVCWLLFLAEMRYRKGDRPLVVAHLMHVGVGTQPERPGDSKRRRSSVVGGDSAAAAIAAQVSDPNRTPGGACLFQVQCMASW